MVLPGPCRSVAQRDEPERVILADDPSAMWRLEVCRKEVALFLCNDRPKPLPRGDRKFGIVVAAQAQPWVADLERVVKGISGEPQACSCVIQSPAS